MHTTTDYNPTEYSWRTDQLFCTGEILYVEIESYYNEIMRSLVGLIPILVVCCKHPALLHISGHGKFLVVATRCALGIV